MKQIVRDKRKRIDGELKFAGGKKRKGGRRLLNRDVRKNWPD
jgi:hypothetical protein